MHAKAFLDVVPCPIIRFRAATEIRQIGHGEPLRRPSAAPNLTTQLQLDLQDTRQANSAAIQQAVERLRPELLRQEYGTFLETAASLQIEPNVREAIWLHGQEIVARWGVSVGRVRVPDRFFRFFGDGRGDSAATLTDDGKVATLKVTDPDAFVPADGLFAFLKVGTAIHRAEKTSMSADGRTATALFPSQKRTCAPANPGDPSRCNIKAYIGWRTPVFRWGNLHESPWSFTAESQPGATRPLALLFPEPEKPSTLAPPELTVPAGHVVLSAPDLATVSVVIRPGKATDPKPPEGGTRPPLPLALSVSGAEIAEILGDSVKRSARFFTVSADTTVTLKLRNVMAGGTVRIQAATLKKDGEIDDGAAAFQDLNVVVPYPPSDSKKKE